MTDIHKHSLSAFFIGGTLLAIISAWMLIPLDILNIHLRLYQLEILKQGFNPQLLYQTNSPFGSVVDIPFSKGGGYFLLGITSLLGGGEIGMTRALNILPLLSSFMLGGTLSLLALASLRTRTAFHTLKSPFIAALLGSFYALLGLILTSNTEEIQGLLLLGISFLILPFYFLQVPPLAPFKANLSWILGLIIAPDLTFIAVLGLFTFIFHANNTRHREKLIVSLAASGFILAALTLTGLTGAQSLFDMTSVSMLHSSLFFISALIATSFGFVPRQSRLWKLSVVIFFAFLFFPSPILPLQAAMALAGVAATGALFWIYAHRQEDSRGLAGREGSLFLAGIASGIALLGCQIGEWTTLSVGLSWIIITLALIGSSRLISVLGIDYAKGWGSFAIPLIPAAAGLFGAVCVTILFPQTTLSKDPIKTAYTQWPTCDNASLLDARFEIAENELRRIMTSPLNAYSILKIPGISVLTLGGGTGGEEDLEIAFSDTSLTAELSNKILNSRSIDGILICGDRKETRNSNTFHNALLKADDADLQFFPKVTLLAKGDYYSLYKVNRN
jgi:hypothetical protein